MIFQVRQQKWTLSAQRNSFEELIQPLVDKTLASCRQTLKDAGLKAEDI